jgi:hypothetical protein
MSCKLDQQCAAATTLAIPGKQLFVASSTEVLAPLMAEKEATAAEEATPTLDDSLIQHEIAEVVTGVEEVGVSSTITTHPPSMFDDNDSDLHICCALNLCCTPNSITEELVICIICNHQAHKICCTEQLSFQQPITDNLVMT